MDIYLLGLGFPQPKSSVDQEDVSSFVRLAQQEEAKWEKVYNDSPCAMQD
jgi:hypothetical protein